jgi:hypothetical protein
MASFTALDVANDVCDAAGMSDACKRCGAPIEWGVDGKRMRVPVEPAEDGGLLLLNVPPGALDPAIGTVPADGAMRVTGQRYRRHSESCAARGRRR